jgi:hypothetical protein
MYQYYDPDSTAEDDIWVRLRNAYLSFSSQYPKHQVDFHEPNYALKKAAYVTFQRGHILEI